MSIVHTLLRFWNLFSCGSHYKPHLCIFFNHMKYKRGLSEKMVLYQFFVLLFIFMICINIFSHKNDMKKTVCVMEFTDHISFSNSLLLQTYSNIN